MFETTLCYIENKGRYLMMLRGMKACDPSSGKWIGVGGKFEKGETAVECMLREVREETGLTLETWHYHGLIEFVSDKWESENMHLFSAHLEGDVDIDFSICDEGVMHWINKDEVMGLSLWEGDRIFLQKIMDGEPDINMRLEYHGDDLVSVTMK
ncbi:MAG: 8-oxo-dGTP diphosphatase [Firmicutes bacterium]|nr:8-oxo-dGTP diphosphatase [Bacillota bacterium]